MGLREKWWNIFPSPCNFSPLGGIKSFQTWDRNCLVASHHPLALNARAVQMLWGLRSWCGCCRVRGTGTRAAILTSAHTRDTNSPSKPPWGSQGWYKQHPNPNLSVTKLPRREAPVLPSLGLPWHWLGMVGAESSSPRSPQAGVKPGLVGCSARASGLGQSSLLPPPQSLCPQPPPSCSLGDLWLPPKYGSKSTLGTATQSRTPPPLLVSSEAVNELPLAWYSPPICVMTCS